jgi:hypothetical protein
VPLKVHLSTKQEEIMNVERVLKLADFIEQLPPHKFIMDVWAADAKRNFEGVDAKAMNPNECGTIGCIAGWAIFLFAERQPMDYRDCPYPATEAAELLDISGYAASQLFHGRFTHERVTREIAAAELRKMASFES